MLTWGLIRCCKLGFFFPIFFSRAVACMHVTSFSADVGVYVQYWSCHYMVVSLLNFMVVMWSHSKVIDLYLCYIETSVVVWKKNRVLVITAWCESACIAVPSGEHRERSPDLDPAPCIFCVVSQAGYDPGVTVCWFCLRNRAEMVLPLLLNDSLILCGSHTGFSAAGAFQGPEPLQ